jgi:hypothetical protein
MTDKFLEFIMQCLANFKVGTTGKISGSLGLNKTQVI